MKTAIVLICGLTLLTGCGTATEPQDYTWDISVVPKEGNEYKFNASLNKERVSIRESPSGVDESASDDTLHVPAIIVTPNKPADVKIGVEGQSADITASVLVKEQGQKTVVTYSVSARQDNVTHTTRGTIEVRK
jgi:hypothetical protein